MVILHKKYMELINMNLDLILKSEVTITNW